MTRERVQYTLRRWLPLLIALGVILVLLFAWNRSRMMMHHGAHMDQRPSAAQQAPDQRYGPRADGNERGNFAQTAPTTPQDRREAFRQSRDHGFQPFGLIRRLLFGAPNQIFTLALIAGVAWLLIRRRRQLEAQQVTPTNTPPNDQNPPVI